MNSDKVFKAKIYLKHHLKASYQLIFGSEEKVEQFVTSLNNDVDFIRIGDDVIIRKTIKKVVIERV